MSTMSWPSMTKGIEEADSEFMLTTYSMLHSVLNKRQKAAMQLNLRVENASIREKREKKREALRSKSNTPQSSAQQRTSSTSKA